MWLGGRHEFKYPLIVSHPGNPAFLIIGKQALKGFPTDMGYDDTLVRHNLKWTSDSCRAHGAIPR
jgi:hypothetical protein